MTECERRDRLGVARCRRWVALQHLLRQRLGVSRLIVVFKHAPGGRTACASGISSAVVSGAALARSAVRSFELSLQLSDACCSAAPLKTFPSVDFLVKLSRSGHMGTADIVVSNVMPLLVVPW